MKKQITVLQTGEVSWEIKYQIPKEINWSFQDIKEEKDSEDAQDILFDVVILEGELSDENLKKLRNKGAAYTFFYTDQLKISESVKNFLMDKRARKLSELEIPDFLSTMYLKYYRGQGGAKLSIDQMEILEPFHQSAEYDGHRAIILEEDFGQKYRQVLFVKYNIYLNMSAERGVELWPEYYKDKEISVRYRIKLFRRGSVGDLVWSRTIDEDEMKEPILILDKDAGYLTVQMFIRGSGKVEIGPFHFRESRINAGKFLVGGQRHADESRGEFISYFDPGDRKPPLTVYFSGYRTAEGFEGYFIMKELGTPFLLLSDPRLEGGAFYLGTPDYENKMITVIQDVMDELGFSSGQVIFSGLSMGTFGAVYYGSIFKPHAIILGKPLVNLGNVAANEKRIRPGGFPTSLDVLRMAAGGNEQIHVEELNNRLWKRFDSADFENTVFVIAYMYQDDYDYDGYADILEHLDGKNITVVGKGLEGRHNDNTQGIIVWFMSQFRRILRQDFNREVIKNE